MLVRPTRRGFIGGLAGLVAAPALVRAESLMPVSVQPSPIEPRYHFRVTNTETGVRRKLYIDDVGEASFGIYRSEAFLCGPRDVVSLEVEGIDSFFVTEPISLGEMARGLPGMYVR